MLYNEIKDGKTTIKSLVDRVTKQIKPEEGKYFFNILIVTRGGIKNIALVHGDFKKLLKPFDSWSIAKKIELAGDIEWASDVYDQIYEVIKYLQQNTHSSPLPIFSLKHQDDVYFTVREKVSEFNASYLKNEYET